MCMCLYVWSCTLVFWVPCSCPCCTDPCAYASRALCALLQTAPSLTTCAQPLHPGLPPGVGTSCGPCFCSSKLGQLLVWDWRSETYVLRQQAHMASDVNCLAYSHDGSIVATGMRGKGSPTRAEGMRE